jgi:hypothetical protein
MELATAVSTGGIAKRARLPRGLPTWDHSQYQLDCYDARITMSLVGMGWWTHVRFVGCWSASARNTSTLRCCKEFKVTG